MKNRPVHVSARAGIKASAFCLTVFPLTNALKSTIIIQKLSAIPETNIFAMFLLRFVSKTRS